MVPNSWNPPKISSLVCSHFANFYKQFSNIRIIFVSLHALHLQNFSNCCSMIRNFSIHITFSGFLQFGPTGEQAEGTRLHTVSFNGFLSGLEWMEFRKLKLLIFCQKLLWNIRSRLDSSTFSIFRSVFGYFWSKLIFAQKMKILIKHIQIQAQKLKVWKS